MGSNPLTIHLLASTPKSQWRTGVEDTFKTLVWQLESEHGRAAEGLLYGRLDLVVCGGAFVALTGWKALPYRARLAKRDLIDLWQTIKGSEWPGGGSERWVWESCFGYLRVLGTEGRSARLVV